MRALGTIRNETAFGGFSAIEYQSVSSDDLLTTGKFTIITDRGSIYTGPIFRNDAGIGTGIIDLEPILAEDLRPVAELTGTGFDAEGLTIAADALYISFEGQHRILRYTLDGTVSRLPDLPPEARLQQNSGIEALATDDNGNVIAIPERSGQLDRPFPVFSFDGVEWSVLFSIPREGPFLVAGADILENRLYVLERAFTGLAFRSRVRSFAMDGSGEQTHLETPAFTHDNLEGITVFRDEMDNSIRLLMISDDNFNPLQQTQIVEYRLPD
ncbi:esterase-like activity of phytase family protein [Aestuariibius sp. 2305UL40-4]|uniref:esterase-like activity of phytase family protein n=1 Tax=Aestuariibius violaceus TaxID=3234132 RepID=UPI00345ED7DC